MRRVGVAERIVKLDKRRVWHPYTPMQDYRERVEPLVIARAEGSQLYDVDGRRYLDANASWWTATLGHGHPRLVEVLRRQAETLCHSALAGIAHEQASELAEALCAVAPAGQTQKCPWPAGLVQGSPPAETPAQPTAPIPSRFGAGPHSRRACRPCTRPRVPSCLR